MNTTERNAVNVTGDASGQPMMFVHGYGCDQHMWRYITPAFESDYQIVVFDQVGNGKSDLSAYDEEKYSTLDGYAGDVLEIIEEHGLRDVVYVGHSVSAMIGVLAAVREPEHFAKLILIGPSPRYVNDEGYVGGFERSDLEEMLDSLDSNYLGWSSAMAPVIMGNSERPELGEELKNSFCRTDPEIARRFARVTFLSDNREDLRLLRVPALVMQCADDVIAPDVVGQYVHENLAGSKMVRMNATGHCPNLSAPYETIAAIKAYL